MKLIKSGKILKDSDTLGSAGIKNPQDFIVCMITKVKKAAAPPAASAPTPTPTPATQIPTTPTPAAISSTSTTATTSESSAATPAPSAASSSSATPAVTTSESSTATAPAAQPAPAAPPASTETSSEFPTEVIENLKNMGFPEPEIIACLRAARGNPDVAVEFLTGGIPAAAMASLTSPQTRTPPSVGSSTTSGGGSGSGTPLAALRSHPQFDDLRRLVQNNPQSLQAVLAQIGQQSPELLQEINGNQAAFIEMMNEPVAANSTNPAAAPPRPNIPAGGPPTGMLENLGMADPAQMSQLLASLSPNELQDMATMMGLTPEQLRATLSMISNMPQDQFQQQMMQALGQGGMGMGREGGGRGGGHILELTEEEMAAVNRLTEMGFDRTEAAQAFIACDKNEALAANLLMDSATQDGGLGGMGGGGGGSDPSSESGGDDMYD
mmetsp:Transcript_12759/g.28157  ORF Transcript_12759/g.28157 Transcript_12759/m.28157 type:complete len:439 (+) Transcript_12759:697-2013(+)